jgi:hypothetical protein
MPSAIRWLPFLLLFALLSPCGAQELEPRRWSHLPTGMHVAGGGYAYTGGDIFFNPVLKLEDVEVDLHTVLAKYIQTFELFGKSARVDFIQGYQQGHWQGLLDGEFAETDRSGLSDGIVRLSVNLLGAPPLQGQDFAAYRAANAAKETIVGVGLAVHVPTGRYFEEKLINLGSNRFVFRPQLGVVHTRGKWSMELTGSAWLFTDNGDFFNGSQLENDPLYALQGHVVHTFRPGLWLAGGSGFGYGSESTIDGVNKDDHKENLLWTITLGYPLSPKLGIKLGYIGGRTQTSIGSNTDTGLVALVYSW